VILCGTKYTKSACVPELCSHQRGLVSMGPASRGTKNSIPRKATGPSIKSGIFFLPLPSFSRKFSAYPCELSANFIIPTDFCLPSGFKPNKSLNSPFTPLFHQYLCSLSSTALSVFRPCLNQLQPRSPRLAIPLK
jgi:hypothetical protein